MRSKKIVVVTGGNGLLGKAFMEDLVSNDYIPISLDINAPNNIEAGTLNCDITDDNRIKECLIEIANHHGKIDGLINNAYPRTNDWGIDFEEENLSSWRKNIDMQLNSYVACCHKVLPFLKKQGGSIVNIASIYGVVSNDPNLYLDNDIKPPAAYTAIKGGIVNFTRYLAAFYGKFNIRVNCISPGGIFDNQDESFVKKYEHKVPLHRMGKPEDIAPAVSFLLSDKASYITGHNLIIDGGWTSI